MTLVFCAAPSVGLAHAVSTKRVNVEEAGISVAYPGVVDVITDEVVKQEAALDSDLPDRTRFAVEYNDPTHLPKGSGCTDSIG